MWEFSPNWEFVESICELWSLLDLKCSQEELLLKYFMTLCSLKGIVMRDFQPPSLLTILCRPHMNRLKLFRRLFRLCEDIQLQSSKYSMHVYVYRHFSLRYSYPLNFNFLKCCYLICINTPKYFILLIIFV